MLSGKTMMINYRVAFVGMTANIESYRSLRSFSTKEAIVGKLFAKHIKLEEAKQFLERARYDRFFVNILTTTYI